MPRFFVVNSNVRGNVIEITGKDAVHINTVLRAKIGDKLTACDKAGAEYTCEIIESGSKNVKLRIIEEKEVDTEPSVRVSLFQALPKADKMELIVQKCVELGVYEIVPVSTSRTIVKLQEDSNKIERFNKISESAAKQCGRGIVPVVSPPLSFSAAVKALKQLDTAVVAYEAEEQRRIKDVTINFTGKTAGIFIGPEGGFSPEEIAACVKGKILPVTLGKRILRTETAGFMALTIFLYEMEGF